MVENSVTLPKEKLCILTPDTFYSVMLREAAFPTFDTRVIRSSEQFQSLAVNFYPDTFLLFSEHLGPTVLAKTLIDIRVNFPKIPVFQIEGVREPRLQVLWVGRMRSCTRPKSISVSNVEDIDRAIRALGDDAVELSNSTSLTNSQIEALRLLAEGRSNQEIAEARNTTIRAVETLLNRSLMRITTELPTSARAKMAIAQRYLGWNAADSSS